MIPAALIVLAIVIIAASVAYLLRFRRHSRNESDSAPVDSYVNSSRLRNLVSQMGLDVDDHNARIKQLVAEVKAMHPAGDAASDAQFANSILQIATANERLQRRLEEAELQLQAQAERVRAHQCEAYTDSLTQIPNRRAFDGEINRRTSEWLRTQAPFSLVLLDIDHFKRLNDTHGHLAGDGVLKRVAAALRAATRDMDLLCRYGGEEFALVLPATTAADAVHIAERLRHAVEKHAIVVEGVSLSITCSTGVADILSTGSSVQLVKRADEALYKSKQAGRNCTHLFNGNNCVPVTPGAVVSQVSPASTLPTEERRSLDRLSSEQPRGEVSASSTE